MRVPTHSAGPCGIDRSLMGSAAQMSAGATVTPALHAAADEVEVEAMEVDVCAGRCLYLRNTVRYDSPQHTAASPTTPLPPASASCCYGATPTLVKEPSLFLS